MAQQEIDNEAYRQAREFGDKLSKYPPFTWSEYTDVLQAELVQIGAEAEAEDVKEKAAKA